ncbi:MAG: glucosyltransferase domain-containing protein, partial [Lachnospiraceae bacterium]|nr:glucosyltransferase domain-containing protein [Lachnospiraceae bacterium]
MKKRYAVAGASAAVFYFLVHGYRFFNPLFSGDALLMIYQNDAAWQIALGRFAQGALVFLRGGITSPFLISLLAVLWTALAVCFAADLLQIKSISALVLNGAIMGVSPAMISANANFLPWVDFYALALFLAVLGVWLVRKGKLLFVTAGILALCGCMAIYQAYICVAIGLFMIGILM